MKSRIATLALCLIALVACGRKAEAPPAAQSAEHGIAWFEGDIAAAFAKAAAEGKPVFLYWGASWCPPCHELKATVFSRPDFIEKMKLFVPVYIDGDAPGAQKLGDEFRVSGYPSVVVLRADRTELARINGGMDLSQYAEVLDLVLGDLRPVGELLASVQSAQTLGRDDCRRLAWNGWDFEGSPAELGELSGRLLRARQLCPADATVERARLTAFAAAAASDAESDKIDADGAPSRELVANIQAVQDLLPDAASAAGAADALQYLGNGFFKAAARGLPDHGAQFLTRWSAVMDRAAVDAKFGAADQLAALGMKLRAMKLLADDKIPQADAAAARQRVELARGQTGYARAGVVNSSLFVLDTLGDVDRAYALVEAEMKTSKYPYYYMLDLASIEEDRGNKAQAVVWLERAYKESQGAATRFQWGTEYALGLMRMQPQEDARIREVTLLVLGELDGPDRIHRRTVRRLEKLSAGLVKWGKGSAHKSTLQSLRARRDALCAAIPEAEQARKDCEAFLPRS